MLQPLLPGRPTLFHQVEQVAQRFLVSPALLFSQLPRPLVELRRHLRRLFPRAAHRHQQRAEVVRRVHKKTRMAASCALGKAFYVAASAATILMLFTPTRFMGLLRSPLLPAVVGVSPIFPST